MWRQGFTRIQVKFWSRSKSAYLPGSRSWLKSWKYTGISTGTCTLISRISKCGKGVGSVCPNVHFVAKVPNHILENLENLGNFWVPVTVEIRVPVTIPVPVTVPVRVTVPVLVTVLVQAKSQAQQFLLIPVPVRVPAEKAFAVNPCMKGKKRKK